MKIMYIAKHDSGGNDDEGAISYALRMLGHEVHPLREMKGRLWNKLPACDFMLFHHWDNPGVLDQVKIPRVFWYFDRVNHPEEPELNRRYASRRQWMAQITPMVDLGFCTDGDWVDDDLTGKLHWLPQGADERLVSRGVARECPTCRQHWVGCELLFTGGRGGCKKRETFLDEVAERYQGGLLVCKGIHQEALRATVASSKIVLAPDGPISDRYWSNRVYLILGFGGFLLHPYCKELACEDGKGYTGYEHLVYYHDRKQLVEMIDYYRGCPQQREDIQRKALAHTLRYHTYRHRCQQLVHIVKENLH